MFRDEQTLVEPTVLAWQPAQANVAVKRERTIDAAYSNDEVGAVWHVYREIAKRIPRNEYTRHASTLGTASQ